MRKHSYLVVVGLLVFSSTAMANSFVNGGFETGDMSSWTLGQGTVSNGTPRVLTPNVSGGRSSSVTATGTDQANKISGGVDQNTNGALSVVYNGTDAARVNDYKNGSHYSSLQQTVTNYDSPSIYFAWAAVLLDPSNTPHTAAETPFFQIKLSDDTTGNILYDISFDSTYNKPPYSFHNGVAVSGDPNNSDGIWRYTDWNPVSVDVSSLTGDTLTLSVFAADCTLGGHGGYAYIDAFSNVALAANPGVTSNPMTQLGKAAAEPVPEPGTIMLMGLGVLGMLGFRRRELLAYFRR